jgi:predicted DNA binding CopG/RHH family protein
MSFNPEDVILDAEEMEIEALIDYDKALPEAEKQAAVEAFRKAAAGGHRKAVTMRLSTSVIEGLKKKAEEDGIPYQTLASMILQKYVRGALLERDAVREVVQALSSRSV